MTIERSGWGKGTVTTAPLAWPNDGEWHHFAIVYDRGRVRRYLDGRLMRDRTRPPAKANKRYGYGR